MTRTPYTAPGRRLFILAGFSLLFLLAITTINTPVSAQSLNDLRASGKVGEAYDGYARARDASVKSTVQTVNAKRRAIYAKRAAEQGLTAEQVGVVYAGKIIAKAPKGTWILDQNGTWRQK